jgi:hypothetical protein
MAEKLAFKEAAAAEYDRAFTHVTAHFMPFMLRAAHIAPGMRVLDIATGTELSAEAALAAVGPTGHVTAADISPAMTEKACCSRVKRYRQVIDLFGLQSKSAKPPNSGIFWGTGEFIRLNRGISAEHLEPTQKLMWLGYQRQETALVESRCGAVAVGRTYLLPPLSFGGALGARP